VVGSAHEAMPLAILQVSTADRLGGAEGSAWNLFQAYRKAGHESWLAVGARLTDDPGVLEIPNSALRPAWVGRLRRAQRQAREAGRARVARAIGAIAWLGEPRRFLEAKLLGREDLAYPGCNSLLDLIPHRPDVLHCHNLHGNYFDLRVLPRLSRRVPLILNLRDEWLLTGHCAYSLGCERWRSGCGHCPDLSIFPAVPRDTTAFNLRRKRRILGAARVYLTAPSLWLLDRARIGIPTAAGFKLIANAIDPCFFEPIERTAARRKLGISESASVIVFSAHSSFKDLATVRVALAALGATRSAVALCLGRSGPPERLGLLELRFHGLVTDAKVMAAAIGSSDVFVHAALAEAFGKGAAEATACGIPVVASRVGGLAEVVRDGVDGLLVPPRDPDALAAAIATLLDNPALSRELGANGRLRAEREFSLDRQVSTFLDWYGEVIADWTSWSKGSDQAKLNPLGPRPTRSA
jgi:glycosyltransferase involved in cell wall biosynthesis